MRLIFEHLATIGFAYYFYAEVEHALLSASPWALIGAAGLAVFLLGHYGRDFFVGLGRVIVSWGHGLQSLGMFLFGIPDRMRVMFNPPASDSSIDRLGWEVRLTRRIVGGLCVIIFVLIGALATTWVSSPLVHEAKTERITPPPAPQPFDKRWMAPGEREGIGGPPPPDVAATPPANPSLADVDAHPQSVRQGVVVSKRPRVREKKDPWDFPRF